MTKLKTYEAFRDGGVLPYLTEKGEDIAEERFQQVLHFKQDQAWVEIQSIYRVQDLDLNEFITWQFIVHATDYFDAEHRKDDSDGTYTNPVTANVKDSMGNVLPARLESAMNAHLVKFSPEAVENLFNNFTYFMVDKNSKEEEYFNKPRTPLVLPVRRRHLTKYYIAKTSVAPDRVAERPIMNVPNYDDFKYLSWDRLYELSTDTRVSKDGELRRQTHPDTIKILESMQKTKAK
jgi:hypothetical protein